MKIKKIGLISATIICINAMIGVGIFTTPAKLALYVGPAGILTYLFSIITVTSIAFSLALVSKAYPQEGSFYNYTKQWAGKSVGFLSALSYIIGIVIALGLLTNVAVQYFHQFFPCLNKELIGISIVCVIAILNILGIRIMQTGQVVLLFCTLGALILTIAVCLFNAKVQNLTPFMPHGLYSVFEAMSAAVFSFLGFESAACLYNIVKDPKINVPKAIILSMLTVGITYIVFIFSIALAIPQSAFTSINMPLSQAILNVFGGSCTIVFLTKIISIAVLTAICGVLQSVMYSCATLALSLLNTLDNRYLSCKLLNFITQNKAGFGVIIAVISLIILFNYFVLKDLNLFFNLTSIFIIFAFLMSILALYFKFKNEKTGSFKEKLIVYSGLISSLLIFINAIVQVVKSILI